jgi:hypothetical protein
MPYIIPRNVIPQPGCLKVVTSGPVTCACTPFLENVTLSIAIAEAGAYSSPYWHRNSRGWAAQLI